MISVIQRMRRVFDARAHANVDRLEDPEQMLNQLQRELVAAVTRAKAGLATARSLQTRVAASVTTTERSLQEALAAAEDALRLGEEDVARSAIERRQVCSERLAQLRSQHANASRMVSKQEAQLTTLQRELTGLKEKRVSLVQRERIARCMVSAGDLATEMAEPMGLVVERMEEKVALHEAMADVALTGADGTEPEAGLDQFMQRRAVDEELQVLRSRMNAVEGDTNGDAK